MPVIKFIKICNAVVTNLNDFLFLDIVVFAPTVTKHKHSRSLFVLPTYTHSIDKEHV